MAKIGRPKSLEDPKVRARLLAAFSLNANVEAACAYANISKDTYYEYIKLPENKDFTDDIENSKRQPYLTATKSVVGNLKEPNFALKYLQHRHPDEFRTRTQMADPNDDPIDTGHDSLREIAKAIKDANSNSKPADPTGTADGPSDTPAAS